MKFHRGMKQQKGFTLIELAVVVIIIGILLVVIAPSIIGSQTGSKATLIQRIADTTANNWSLLASQAGTGTTVASNPIAKTISTDGVGVSEVLYEGQSKVADAYVPAYTSTGIKAMSQLVGKSGGVYGVSGTTGIVITLGGGGTAPMTITFDGVPPEIVANLVQKIQPSLALTTGSAQTVGQMTYTCPATGLCNVVFSRPV